MTRTHGKCGGRMVPQKSTVMVAYFRCDKCNKLMWQRKRLPKEGALKHASPSHK